MKTLNDMTPEETTLLAQNVTQEEWDFLFPPVVYPLEPAEYEA